MVFFFQAEDGIRDLVRSRGLGDVYKRQINRAIFLSITLATTFFLTGCQNFENFDSVTPPALSLIHI